MDGVRHPGSRITRNSNQEREIRLVRGVFLAVAATLACAALLRLALLAVQWSSGIDGYAADLMFFGLLGAAALCILVVIGAIPGVKAFGFELDLVDVFAAKSNEHAFEFNDLAGRIAELERIVGKPDASDVGSAASHNATAPALVRPIIDRDDEWKGRFGGLAERSGFELSARFAQQMGGRIVEIELVVRATLGRIEDGRVAEFFLHPTFTQSRVTVPFRNGTARLKLLAWGGFTVGVWIPAVDTELELDLSADPGAPKVIREL